MSAAPYVPRPGTGAARALSYLEKHGPTSAPDLADAIGVKPASGIHTLMQASITHGLVRKERGSDNRVWFIFGKNNQAEADAAAVRAFETDPIIKRWLPAGVKGKPLSWVPSALEAAWHPRANGKDTPAPDSQQVLKATGASPDATDRDPPAPASPVGGPMGAGQPAAAGPLEIPVFVPRQEPPPDRSIRFALWSNGTLEIQRETVGDAASLVLLTRDEAQQLAAFLNSPKRALRSSM